MRAYVAVGTNLGDRWRHLRYAASELRKLPGVSVLRASRVYDTEALGPPHQPRYLNAVLEVESALPAPRLLRELLQIEKSALRRRDVRWGARTLDLDLLLFGGMVLRTPELTVPHPRLVSRRFVLAPLAELCPRRVVPGTGRTVAELLRSAPPHEISSAGLYPL